MVSQNLQSVAPLLTTGEVARLLNVHVNTIRRWTNQGILPAFFLGSRGDRRFRQEDIEAFLAGDNQTRQNEKSKAAAERD